MKCTGFFSLSSVAEWVRLNRTLRPSSPDCTGDPRMVTISAYSPMNKPVRIRVDLKYPRSWVRIEVDRWGYESVVRWSDSEVLMSGLNSGSNWATQRGLIIRSTVRT